MVQMTVQIGVSHIFFEHDDCCKMWWDKVTHWMPLPEPPKEEKEEG